ncbi:hypothetical protein PMAYCL1PPCAC_21943 [Pristionchus mayeri]|uniref:Uncharacterized protein n=1 Tax=Pristionchus mayeri TaxID=1317129 RepID=A0AAN5I4C7_9BILA|nr:hypothetical protein PMAYCL1PPCAC_21943 [Pristionchus mayeri]
MCERSIDKVHECSVVLHYLLLQPRLAMFNKVLQEVDANTFGRSFTSIFTAGLVVDLITNDIFRNWATNGYRRHSRIVSLRRNKLFSLVASEQYSSSAR